MAGTADCGVTPRTAATIGQGFAGGIASVLLGGLRCHPERFFSLFSLVPRWTLLFDTAISAPAPQECIVDITCALEGALCSFPMHLSHSRCCKLNFVPPSLLTDKVAA